MVKGCPEHGRLDERLKNIEKMMEEMHKSLCGTYGINVRLKVLEVTVAAILVVGFGFEAWGKG